MKQWQFGPCFASWARQHIQLKLCLHGSNLLQPAVHNMDGAALGSSKQLQHAAYKLDWRRCTSNQQEHTVPLM